MSQRQAELHDAMTSMAAGNRAALDTVYAMTSGKLFATIIRIVRARDRAEDVLQDVYVKAWQRADRFDPARGSAIAWLCTIARNTALDALRREGRQPDMADLADDGVPEPVDDTKPVDDWLCDGEDSAALHRCLEGLKEDYRRSIKLAFFEGFTHSELAERVKVPLGTMKSWIRRGLAGLRGCLDA